MNYLNTFMNYWYTSTDLDGGKKEKVKENINEQIPKESTYQQLPVESIQGISDLFIIPTKETKSNEKLEKIIKTSRRHKK